MGTLSVLPSLAVTQAVESRGCDHAHEALPSACVAAGGGCLARHRLQFSFARDREGQGVIQSG